MYNQKIINLNNNKKHKFIESLGIQFVLSVNWMFELISCKILVDNNVYKYAIFCDGGINNKGCHKCSKSF